MIAFDNGPENGDYARYIDALMASRAALPLIPNSDFNQGMNEGSKLSSPALRSPVDAQRATRPSAAQTSAIAAALMSGEVAAIGLSWPAMIAFVVGAALIVIGLVAATFNAPFMLAGIALIAWVIKQLGARGALARASAARSQAQAGNQSPRPRNAAR
jgi:hypothetical protein